MTKTRTETLPLTDGTELRFTIAEPETAVRGGLVVLHEARGVTDLVRGLVSSLADAGWLAIAPHLYHRDGADELDEADQDQVRDQVSRLSGESILADTDAAFVWLGQQGVTPDRMGVIGFNLGGSVAIVVAASRTLGAAVSVGGDGVLSSLPHGLPSLLDVAGELTCPWLGIYGDQDGAIAPEEVEKLREAVAAAPVATDLVRYPGALDGFDSDPRSAAEAWQRTLNWFDLHLR